MCTIPKGTSMQTCIKFGCMVSGKKTFKVLHVKKQKKANDNRQQWMTDHNGWLTQSDDNSLHGLSAS